MLAPRWQIHSPQGVRLVVPERRLDGAEARLLALPEIQIRRGLAEVAVVLAPDARRVLGILAIACQRLALDGVNIVETVDGFGQHTFLVAEEQAETAVRALKRRRPARA
jgi:aspartokinase